MDKLLGSLSLGLMLRSLFAGVFLVVSFAIAANGPASISCFASTDSIAINLGLSLFVGVVAYTVHRSMVYPLVEWWLNSTSSKKLRENAPLITQQTIAVLQAKWDQAAGEGNAARSRVDHLTSWGDFAHLQYASALCIAIGSWSGAAIGDGETRVYWPLVIAATILCAAALISDWRWHSVYERLPPV